MQKKKYTGFSVYSFINNLLIRLGLVAGLVYIIPHYDENPLVITILSAIGAVLIVILGNDEITVYADRITKTDNSFLSLFFKWNKKVLYFKNIKRAYLEQKPASTLSESVLAVAAAMILNGNKRKRNGNNPIYFELGNGEIMKLETDLDITTAEKIADMVNALIQNN